MVFICGLLTACTSDDMEELLFDRVSSIQIAMQRSGIGSLAPGLPSEVAIATYPFEYDALGRVVKVGYKTFYYGSDGKVAYSKEGEINPSDNYYFERLSYHWDGQGRLKEVYVDSLYQRYQHHDHQPVSNEFAYQESKLKDELLATFSYEGDNRRPSTIKYRKMNRALPSLIVTLGEEEEIHYIYENENVVSVQRDGYLKQNEVGLGGPVGLIPYKMEMAYTYLSNPHHLARIYTQLGFHPYKLTEVVSVNCIARSQVSIEIEGGEDIGDRWTRPEGVDTHWTDLYTGSEEPFLSFGKSNYSYRFNTLELPTEIVVEGDGTMQRTLISYE
ncbi:hypothetical protein [Sphingobacterium sp. SGR-19]|uniref:hypothetical protein n=1 Tax=Sphingobacterium sp. SGR-19 TaxID=2710886 RepID=UPI0013EE01E1|nr:hypothetical protein [Sphingobacterium sp. SGR-19]NGM64620.1 hypothetical protein [Sphingobacterium sp. SGR-19]